MSMRNAAILLLSLPQEQAAELLAKLQPKQIEQVSIEIAQLGRINSEEQEAAIEAFARANPNALGGEEGSLDLAKSLVEKALGKNAASTVNNLRQTVEAMPFSFLRGVDPAHLQTFITDEHPQTIALILSHLPSTAGAEIIANLPAERQMSVIRRIANMGQTNPEVIEEVESGLESRMASMMSQSYQNAGGVPTVAEILNVTERATERALLESMSQEDPELVEDIRRLMFVFDDIAKLTDKDIQSVLKNIENSQWALALKSASEALREKILGNMSQRAAQMLSEEMEFLGSVKLSEVEAMQQQIVDVVRKLEDAGQITVHNDADGDEYID